jgi:hypothetical protein
MAGFVPRSRAESALRFLPQKLALVEPFHIANHKLLVRELVDHVERDDVLLHVAAVLRRRLTFAGRAWVDESVKAGAPRPLPEDPVECMAFRFDVLKQLRLEKIDLRYFVANFYQGEHLNERLMHWKRAIVHPLLEDLRRFARLLLDRLPEGERFDMEELAAEVLDGFGPMAFGSRVWTEADDDAETDPAETPSRGAGPADLDEALEALERAVASASELTADEKHDLTIDARIIATEVRAGKKGRAGGRLDVLARTGSLRAAVEEVRKRL